MRSFRVLLTASVVFAVCAHAQDATPTPSARDVLLYPSHITLTGHFEAPLGPTAVERVIQSVDEQIDVKRAADAARSQIAPLWDLRVWRYLPADPAHTLNSPVASDGDPFFTPDYLKVSGRQLDYQFKKSERASQELLRRLYLQPRERLTRRCSEPRTVLMPSFESMRTSLLTRAVADLVSR